MAKKDQYKGFFEDLEPWKKEWQDMPEFVQEDLTPFQSIIIHFENKNDRNEFSELIKQKLTDKTKSIYYPKVKRANLLKKRCTNES